LIQDNMAKQKKLFESFQAMDLTRTMHKEISKLLKKEDQETNEYVVEFLNTIAQTIEKLEIFSHHIIWEYVSERLPGKPASEDRGFLWDITKKTNPNILPKRNDFFKQPINKSIQLPSRKAFNDKLMEYSGTGKPGQIFDLPIKEGHTYFNLPIFPGGVPGGGDDDWEPHWIFTFIYKEEDKDLVNSEEFFKFMDFFSNQLSLALDTFLEHIANKIKKKIDIEIDARGKEKSLSDEEALRIISSALAKEFQADLCAFFLLDEQKKTLKLASSNLDLLSQIDDKSTNVPDIALPCYEANKTLRIFDREKIVDAVNKNILEAVEKKVKSINYCLCIPISIGRTRTGTMTFLRSKAIKSPNPGNEFLSVRPPFSECETNLLKKVRRHIFDVIISYFNLQQRMKDMRNVIEQVTAPVKSLVGHTEEIIKGRVRKEKILGKVTNMNKLAKISLKYAANFEKLLELDSKQINLKKERLFDLRDYLIGLSIEYQPLIRKKCISIRVNEKTPNDIDLYVDKELFYHSIANVLDNSVKYSFSPEEREKLGLQAKPAYYGDKENVLIEAKEKNNDVVITISSYGLEILEEERERIFDKEFRGAKAIERFNVGAGLGLYIARKIVELHKGKIELLPNTKKYNTVFKITLPKGEVN
jgi:signal transduction histidine kinase